MMAGSYTTPAMARQLVASLLFSAIPAFAVDFGFNETNVVDSLFGELKCETQFVQCLLFKATVQRLSSPYLEAPLSLYPCRNQCHTR